MSDESIMYSKSRWEVDSLGKPYKVKCLRLQDHCHDVRDAVVYLFGRQRKNLLEAWQRFFKLSNAQVDEFLLLTTLAGLLHDIGKATDCFQNTLTESSFWGVRHEHVSALLCHSMRWPAHINSIILTMAILAHHTKATWERVCTPYHVYPRCELLVHLQSPDVSTLISDASSLIDYQLVLPPDMSVLGYYDEETVNGVRQLAYSDQANRLCCELDACSRKIDGAVFRAVKAGLIQADAVGSAMRRLDKDAGEFIANSFTTKCTRDYVNNTVILPKKEKLINAGKWKVKPYQETMHARSDRALLLSACGSGKTLAAWTWAASKLQGDIDRVIFAYPTCAAANEGFLDYLSAAPSDMAALLHHTSAYELHQLGKAKHNSRDNWEDYTTATGMFSLGRWDRGMFATTVDQFLSFNTHNYGAITSLPVLAKSALVVDEVHALDCGMFDALVRTLRAFDFPVLCMTATLSESRKLKLLEAELELIEGDLHEQEYTAPRYRVHVVSGEAEALKAANKYSAGVLWVANQVRPAQYMSRFLNNSLPFHSRFKRVDRVARQRFIIDTFNYINTASTQVCEMSLDLSARLLVTEAASISALVQRLGRLNRLYDGVKDAYIFDPMNRDVTGFHRNNAKYASMPYTATEVADGMRFARALEAEGEVSMKQVIDIMNVMFDTIDLRRESALFSDTNPFVYNEAYRSEQDYSATAVMPEDAETYNSMVWSKDKNAPGLLLNIPVNSTVASEIPKWKDPWVRIAVGTYSEREGYLQS